MMNGLQNVTYREVLDNWKKYRTNMPKQFNNLESVNKLLTMETDLQRGRKRMSVVNILIGRKMTLTRDEEVKKWRARCRRIPSS